MRPIALLRIAGAAITLKNDAVSASAVSPANAGGQITVSSSGNVTDSPGGLSYSWLRGANAANYEIRATVQSNAGLTTSGSTSAFGSFLNLGTTRSWNAVRTSVGTGTATVLLEIRPVGGSVIASATVNFTCDVS